MISNLYSFNIDSKLRISGTDDNFEFRIDLDNEKRKLINMCAISYISIPKSYYLVDEFNCFFSLIENNYLIQLNIPFGNYTKNQIKQKLKDVLNASTVNNIIYDVIDAATDREIGKITITATNNTIIKKLIFGSEINEIFGFEKNIEYTFTSSITSVNIINLNQENTLYLKSNIVTNNYNQLGNNTLQVVYCGNIAPFSYIVDQYDIIYNMKPYINQEIFNFSLVNENGNRINLNGVNMSFILNLFTFTNINNKISNYIDYKILNDK